MQKPPALSYIEFHYRTDILVFQERIRKSFFNLLITIIITEKIIQTNILFDYLLILKFVKIILHKLLYFS